MKLHSFRIKNFNSIKDTDIIELNNILVLAGQNESGKSSILKALNIFYTDEFLKETLNFELQNTGNFIQEIECTYILSNIDNFIKELTDLFSKEYSINSDEIFNKSKLEKIRKLRLKRTIDFENDKSTLSIDDVTFQIIKKSILQTEIKSINEEGEEIVSSIESIIPINDEENNKIAEIILSVSPSIILYDDFSTLLPDEIFISDLVNKNYKAIGYKAVKNLEQISGRDFTSFVKQDRAQRRTSSSKVSDEITLNFEYNWKQRLDENNTVKIKLDVEPKDNANGQKDYSIAFYIESKTDVLLPLRLRSSGMRWFLSNWLELKTKNSSNFIILYDEPGLYLHIKAHKDILDLFDELNAYGNQVIYTTHSPSLINLHHLSNIDLVINSNLNGTTVENLTTSLIDTTNKKDALQPISEAMGLVLGSDFNTLHEKNVILEGLSDFYYFQAFVFLLKKKLDYKFVPGIGVKNNKLYPLISFCIGYGLKWLIVLDAGINAEYAKKELLNNIFDNDITKIDKKIHTLPTEIEELFNPSDFLKVDNAIANSQTVSIGDSRKIIISKDFCNKVLSKEIIKKDINSTTINKFEEIFKWIDRGFKS